MLAAALAVTALALTAGMLAASPAHPSARTLRRPAATHSRTAVVGRYRWRHQAL